MTSLHYHPIGEGPDLVLLHGFAMNADFLKPLAEKLSEHYRVHLFDLPGFGALQHKHLFDQPAQLSEYLLKQLPTKAIWIGWSLGGLIASWTAIYHPSRVNAVINITSSPYFLAQSNWPGIERQAFFDFFHHLKQNYRQAMQRFLSLQVLNTPIQKTALKHLKQILNAQKPLKHETLDAALTLLSSIDLRQKIHCLTKPCLYLFGERDSLVPSSITHHLTPYQNIKTHILPEASHLPFFSHLNTLLLSIHSFLSENPS